jgi:DNA-binding MarR family transcriptional regulator
MPIFKKWYPRKKPTLQIEILRSIAIVGESSKRRLQDDLGAHYPDISDAIESLKKENIIEQSHVDFKSKRHEIYYKLTNRGLEAIIDEFSEPEIFWKAIISYYELSSNPIKKDEFNKYYNAFETKFVGYSQTLDFFFQIEFMDEIINRWLGRNRSGPTPISQKVFECIALHRSVTSDQIIKYIQEQDRKDKIEFAKKYPGESIDLNALLNMGLSDYPAEFKLKFENDSLKMDVIKTLEAYTLSSNHYSGKISEAYEPTELNTQYFEFFNRLLIREIESKTDKRYELTLFGVILILVFIYYSSSDRSRIYFNDYLTDRGWRDDYSIEKYYDIVVSNYKDKLPLIFGKWQLLVKVFHMVKGADYVGRVFTQIFNKQMRKSFTSWPINMDGIKELYENMQRIVYQRYSKLTELYESGWSALETVKEVNTSLLSIIKETLHNVELLLVSADLKKFMGYISKQNYCSINQTSIITAIENSFANETSFLFYIFLTRNAEDPPDYGVELGDDRLMPSNLYESTRPIPNGDARPFKPRDFLLDILRRDNEIKDKVVSWIKDSITYESQIVGNMLNLQTEIDSN